METANELLPYIRLKFELEHPDLEDCWSQGYRHAEDEGDQGENPYEAGSLEAEYWDHGWWAGFYGEPAWSENVASFAMKDEGNMTKIETKLAANEPHFDMSDRIRRWTTNVVKVASVVAVTVAAIELLDLAS